MNNFELNLWLKYILETHSNLQGFFEDNNINTVAIYGFGELGKLFYDECTNTGLNVKYIIDRANIVTSCKAKILKYPCYMPDDVDALIICLYFSFECNTDIIKLFKQSNAKTYMFIDILFSQLLKKHVLPKFIKTYNSNNLMFYDITKLFQIPEELLSDYELASFLINPVTSNFVNNPHIFKKIYNDIPEYSDIYIKEVFTQSPVISNSTGIHINSDVTGRYVNIINGVRLTVGTPERYKKKVHWIGDCRVLGYGVDDTRTMPSVLQKLFNKSEKFQDFINVNHGVWGYDLIKFYINPIELTLFEDINKDDILLICISLISGSFIINDYYLRYIYNIFDEFGIKFISFYEDFAANCKKGLFIDYPHINHRGMNIVANKIYEIMETMDIIDSDSSQLNFIKQVESCVSTTNDDFQSYSNYLKTERVLASGKIGSIVMNCNPFTNGHKFLIENAANVCDFVYVFVVEEDKSIFPFKERLELVEAGTMHIKNIKVLRSGSFILSARTFPEYFIKESLKEIKINPASDIEFFAKSIAPILNISCRFVGNEPLCNITRQYNQCMQDILPKYGIELIILQRIECHGLPVSATIVRTLLESRNFNELKSLVPKTTFDYLCEKYIT